VLHSTVWFVITAQFADTKKTSVSSLLLMSSNSLTRTLSHYCTQHLPPSINCVLSPHLCSTQTLKSTGEDMKLLGWAGGEEVVERRWEGGSVYPIVNPMSGIFVVYNYVITFLCIILGSSTPATDLRYPPCVMRGWGFGGPFRRSIRVH